MATRKGDQLPDSGQNDPMKLRGLRQALFILDCLCDGDTEDQIAAKFSGDDQLVKMWFSFMKHNHWLSYDEFNNKWLMTQRAKIELYRVANK